MRVHAYVLAGDPAWAAHSVRSYYDLVDRIIVSHDRHKRSWAGLPLQVDEALGVLQSADTDGKMHIVPGAHSDPSRDVLEVETEQRQSALDAASDGCDVVLQLDTDEILLDSASFLTAIEEMVGRGATALEYPLRDFYADVGGGRYLEHCRPFWGTQAAYPGPVAVLAGTRLVHCRQASGDLYRVDVRARNSDPWHPRSAPVHATVTPTAAIAHMSWVRSNEQMEAKSRTSGYASSRNWERDLQRWRWRTRHPRLTALSAPLHRDPYDRFRVSRPGLPST